MMMDFIAFGNDELENRPIVHAGDKLYCSRCGGVHIAEMGDDVPVDKREMILFTTCQDEPIVVALDNRLITPFLTKDVHDYLDEEGKAFLEGLVYRIMDKFNLPANDAIAIINTWGVNNDAFKDEQEVL